MVDTVTFCGRTLKDTELALARQIIAEFPGLSQLELAHTICELLEWRRPNGKLKGPECVEFLRKLEGQDRLPALPPPQKTKPSGAHRLLPAEAISDPQAPLRGRLASYQPLRLDRITDTAGRRLFQQYIQRYHPLGYRVPYGAQLRYFVRGQSPSEHLLGCLLFTSAAWKMAPRDKHIGWCDQARRTNLPLVVNNSRFLILPWVEVPHLASHILALAARQLPGDWLRAYSVRPVLLETLVDPPYPGTCYRAANWICVGQTQGRGRMDRRHEARGSRKDILLYPLQPHWRESLCRIPDHPVESRDPSGILQYPA